MEAIAILFQGVKQDVANSDEWIKLIFGAFAIWLSWITIQYIWDKVNLSAERSAIKIKLDTIDEKLDHLTNRLDLFIKTEVDELKELSKR